MFGNQKNTKTKATKSVATTKSSNGSTNVEALIGTKIHIKGDLNFDGCLFIQGRVEGIVRATPDASNASVHLSSQGRVDGDIHAPHINISGELYGNVHASEHLQLQADAKVVGDLHYRVLEMAPGAVVTGRLIHMDAEATSSAKPELVHDAKDEPSKKGSKAA